MEAEEPHCYSSSSSDSEESLIEEEIEGEAQN